MNHESSVTNAATVAPEGAPTVLLVDDDAISRKLLGVCLAAAGYRVSVATNADEALNALRGERPDVLVSDVLLGDLDGFALCKRVRGDPAFKDLPIVLVSSHFQEEEDRRLARAVGANALAERTPDCRDEMAAIAGALNTGAARPRPSNPDVPELYTRRMAGQMTELLSKAKDAEARYSALFENAKDAISVLSPEGVILEANGRWERILQLPREQIVGHHIRQFSPPESADASMEAYQRSIAATSKEDAIAVPVRRSDGKIIYVEISSSPVETGGETVILNIGRDVTENIEAARRLEASEAKYRTLLERIPDVVWTARPDGSLSFISANVERLSGFSQEQALKADVGFWLGRIHPEDVAVVRGALRQLGQAEEAMNVEFRWQRSDGTWLWLSARARASQRGGEVCIDGLVTDVSVRRTLEDQMRQAQKMEAVGQLTGGVAHDFNNVLAVVLINAQLLIEELGEHDPRRVQAEEIKTAAERAATLTRQLLAFSRKQLLSPTHMSVRGLVDGVEKMLRRLIGEDIDFSVVHGGEAGSIVADSGQVEQVVLNLVVNARDAMPDGGKLTIETSNVDLDEEYCSAHVPATPGRYIMLAVSDTGCGMDEETRRRAFEPFYTTKEKGKGTGLGLSTCYGIVKQIGGFIWIYSEPGRGTTFKVYFPRSDQPAEAAAPRAELADLRGTETVLVIEDEEQVRKAVQRVLSRLGYRVLLANDGEQALAVVRANKELIDLVLSDVVVPGASGPDVVKELAKLSNRMKTLFMSGYTDHAVLRNGALQAGVNFIQKPFAPTALATKVREILSA